MKLSFSIRTTIIWIATVVGAFAYSFILIEFGNLWQGFTDSGLNVTWVFSGTKDDFAEWFPRFHSEAYYAVRAVPWLAALVVSVALVLVLKRVFRWFDSRKGIVASPVESIPLESVVVQAASYVLISLSIFVLGYFSIKKGFLGQGIDSNAQLLISRGFAITVLALIALLVVQHWQSFRERVREMILHKSGPYNLAILRIVFFGFMTVVFWMYPHYHGFYFDQSPVGLPYMNWYIDLVNLTREQYTWISRFGAVVNFMICIGLWTRPMLWLNSVLAFVVIATPNFYGKLYHQHLWIWIPWILAFSKCADVLSVDRWLASRNGSAPEVETRLEYGLPIRLIWVTFGVVYFFPGFQKLWTAGFDWALSDSMLNQIFVEWHQHYGWRSFIPVERFPNLVKLGGLWVILFEMAFPFLLLHERTRKFAVIGGISFHVVTGLVLRIWFPPVLFMYIFFIDWAKLFRIKGDLVRSAESSSLSLNNRLAIFVTVVLLVGNSICGFLSVYSYPFTSFPGYTNIYSDEFKLLRIDVLGDDGDWHNVDDLLALTDYRRENNTTYEDQILEAYLNQMPVRSKVDSYWKLLSDNVPQLREVKGYRFTYQLVPLHPDRSGEVLSESLILEEVPSE